MKCIKKLFKVIRAYRWGKRLMSELGESFRVFAVFYLSNDEIGITFVYNKKCFSVMNFEKIKSYNDFAIRASAEFLYGCNDKWEVKL